MSDPINDIFNGTPDGIDEDELKEMQAADAQRVADAEALKNENQEEMKPETAKADLAPEPKEENKPMPVEDILAGKGPVAPGEAAATGVIDWGIDLINMIPGVSAPKLPKYQDEVATAVRDISSVVIPTVGLTVSGVGALSAAGKASKAKILADPFVKWLGTTSASAGIGAGVDFVAETNQTDDNVLGTLKKNFPKTYGWVPDDLATLDSDSPDQKRAKNVYEGIGLGFLTDVIGGAVKLAKGLAGSDSATRWIPESEKAKNWLKNNAPDPTDTPEAVIEKGVAKRTEDLDNVGGYNFQKSQNLDEPIFGLHDMYGYEEMGIRSADDMGIVGASIDQVRIAKNIDTVYGRLGSVMTEPAMKFALEGAEEYEAVIKGLRETLVEADEIGYRVKGRTITAKEVQDEGLRFAANLNQMDIDDMRRLLDANRPDKAGNTLNEVAAKGVRFAIKEAMQELKASALVRGSLAGQVSDMAQGSRFAEGTATTVRSE